MPPVQYESLADALAGTSAPKEIISELALVEVPFIDLTGAPQASQLIIHHELAQEIQEIFAQLYKERFPIEKIVPIASYGWDDEASMADNNTSAFNYRTIIATDRLSNHSYGRAIDINPRLNPYLARDQKIYPAGATYDVSMPGTIASDSKIVQLFLQYGWSWGGDWDGIKDYQHFEKSGLRSSSR